MSMVEEIGRRKVAAHRACKEPDVQRELARFNKARITPGLGGSPANDVRLLELERRFVEQSRREIASLARHAPAEPRRFIEWFETLRDCGPGQGDSLFRTSRRSRSG